MQRKEFEKVKQIYDSLIQKKSGHFEYRESDYEVVESLQASDLTSESLTQSEALLRSGKVAVLIMAGGQGSRLNHNCPKGTFELDLGEFGKKSIFALHMEYLHFLFLKYGTFLRVFIMTGESNHEQTVAFFEQNQYFQYPKNYITFLQQNMMPCVDLEGNLLYASKDEPALAPDGNAGFSELLKKSSHMEELLQKGVKYLYVHNVDNILTKFADVEFLASLIQSKSQIAVKVTAKSHVDEKVGVLLKYKNAATIIEYSELPKEILTATNEDGSLKFSDGSIGSYIFDLEFLDSLEHIEYLYHLAKKKIPYFDGEKMVEPTTENGYKFEAYIFDLFQYAKNIVSFKVEKEMEFAPVKNAHGADSPESAALLYFNRLNRLNQEAYEEYLNYEKLLTMEGESKIAPYLESAHSKYMDLYNLYKRAQSLYYLAIISFNQKNYLAAYNNAIRALRDKLEPQLKEDLLSFMPKISDFMHLEQAQKYVQTQQFFDALEELESIGESLEDSFEYHFNLALCRRRVGQRNNVSHHLKRAYVLNPTHADLYAEIAANMIYEGDLEGAKKSITEGLKLDPNSYNLTAIMADYYDIMNKEEDRDACLRKLDEIEKRRFEDEFDL